MSNEELLEEMIYQAHKRGNIDKLHSYARTFKEKYPNLRAIDHYDMACAQIEKESNIIK